MSQKIKMIAATCMVVGVLSAAANAADPIDYVGAPAKHFHEVDNDFMKAFHNPMEGLTMGLDLRLREVYARNLYRVNDATDADYHWQRYRTRWSTRWALNEDVDFNSRLTWEFWGHCAAESGTPNASAFFRTTNYDFDEALFDHFNIQIRNAFDLPLTLTVGRQDIILGTGWLVLDGTPADGSRTIFFDAIRGTYDLSESAKLDLIYIQQYDDEEQYIKPFNHHAVQDRRHLTQKGDERGFIFYLTNKAESGQQQELYYMYKNEKASDWAAAYSPGGQNADIHTIGGRLSGPLDDNWSYSAEMAKQFGDRNGNSLQALGGNSKLMYSFNDEKKNELHVGYEYLSGNDPDTSADEEFDTLWGDLPQSQRGGDLQFFIWTAEGASGQVTNLHRFGIGHSFKPSDVWTLATDYNLMFADENSEATGGSPSFSSGDNFRGHMLTGLATYQCCKNFKTQFLVDYFIPGSYYQDGDDAYFTRINMEWSF